MTLNSRKCCLNNNPVEKKKATQVLLKEEDIPSQFRDPFITDGYRKPGCSFWQCCRSIFEVHNETVNVWSHLAAVLLFGIFTVPVFKTHNPLNDYFVYPLLSFAVGISAMLIMSSAAHLFNSMSSKVRHICFFLDYAAISTFTFTAGQVFFFYSRPTNTTFYPLQSATLFFTVSAFISASSTYLCCASRHQWIKHKFIIRTGTYTFSWVHNTMPFLWRVVVCDGIADCNTIAYRFFIRQFLCFFVAALSNASKIPERFTPGWFNIFGQSHHFMHVLCALGSFDDFLAVQTDMIGRRGVLTSDPSLAVPTFVNSILLMIAIFSINIAIVVWFAIKCPDHDAKD